MRVRAVLIAAGLVASALTIAPTAASAAATTENVWITSNAPDANQIRATVFRPDGASAENPVPLVIHSHGWGGSRSTSGFGSWLDNGYGVLSFDQRGFGESGGEANVEDPTLEGLDVEAIIDYIAGLDWVAKDGGTYTNSVGEVTADPTLFAIGGSYGGGYQMIGALTEVRNNGSTRFNALAPEITWYDLPNSLAPEGVVRMVWVTALYAAGASALPQYVHEAFVQGAVAGEMPASLQEEFYKHSPAGFVEPDGRAPVGQFNPDVAVDQLDIPIMIGQGATDNLFNLNQGINIFQRAVTPAAQQNSFFVGYNGGHVLPDVFPPSTSSGGSACGTFSTKSREFFDWIQDGGTAPFSHTYNIASNSNTCVQTDTIDNRADFAVDGPIAQLAAVVGPYQQIKIADGPLTVHGIPTLTGNLTSLGVDVRAFVGLSVGTSPLDAAVVQNNLLPVRRTIDPTGTEVTTDDPIELPGVAVEVAAGQSLYLTVASTNTQFLGFGSRVPGALVINDPVVHLPVPAAVN